MGFFLKQSGSRLTKIRSGNQLFTVIDNQRKRNAESLKEITSAKEAIVEQIANIPDQSESASSSDSNGSNDNEKYNLKNQMYQLQPRSRDPFSEKEEPGRRTHKKFMRATNFDQFRKTNQELFLRKSQSRNALTAK